MARKLSDPGTTEQRLTRTERVVQQREQAIQVQEQRLQTQQQQQEFEQVQAKLSTATYSQYQSAYSKLPSYLQARFKKPESIKEQFEQREAVQQESKEWRLAQEYYKRQQQGKKLFGIPASIREKMVQISKGQPERITASQVYKKEGYEPAWVTKEGEKVEMSIIPQQAKELGLQRALVKTSEVETEQPKLFQVLEQTKQSYVPLLSKYTKFEQKISEKIPSHKETAEWLEKTQIKITEKTPFLDPLRDLAKTEPTKQDIWFKEKVVKYPAEFGMGMWEGVKERPVTTAALTGAFFVLPGVLAGVGKVAAPLFTAFPQTAAVIGTGVKVALPVVYGTSVVYRVSKAPKGKRVFQAGKITSTEIAPILVGGYYGTKFWTKMGGYWRTRGRVELKTKDLVPKDVLTGKHRFPEAPPKEHLRLFLKESQRIPGITEPTLYHQAPIKFWDSKVLSITQRGTSELPGLYGSYGISPHFLKVSGAKYSLYGGKFFTPYGSPATAGVIPSKFVVGKTAKPGQAFIPKIKTEVEAILPLGTEAYPLSQKYFYKWKGIRIPLDIFKVSDKTISSAIKTTQVKTILRSYYAPTSYPITTPASYALASIVSSKISKPYSSSSISKLSQSLISSSKSLSKSLTKSYITPSSVSKPSKVSKPSISSISKIYKPSKYTPSSVISSSVSYTPFIYIPPPPTPMIWLPKKKRREEKKLKPYKVSKEYLYGHGFTEKLLGIKAIRLSLKQAEKLVKSEVTPFEILPPVIIKKKKKKKKKK